MKRSLSLYLATLLCFAAQAHEGMWLLNKIKQVNEAEMRQLGLKLTAEDIYDINRSSLKDAVVRLGPGFCTGEMVSAEGLFLTNHHCAQSAVQQLSSVKDDYLTHGFWAMARKDELRVRFHVSFLQRIEDVTDKVLAELNDGMSEEERGRKVQETGNKLRTEASQGNGISADFRVMYEGNEFHLYVYKTYRDVRLVGVPPKAIGTFGGDTDNWMWPRHTGDFALFRVYTGPDGEPADPDDANIPYRPAHHFPVSLQGVKEGDFAMVMGYPGSTDRFRSSHGLELTLNIDRPARVKVRAAKLDIMKAGMDKDDAVRIQYASKYAGVSNYWKKYLGEQRGLKRLHVHERKKKQEEELMAWVHADPARKARYGDIMALLEKGHGERAKLAKADAYMREAAFGCEFVQLGRGFVPLRELLAAKPVDEAKVKETTARLEKAVASFWKDYHPPTDQRMAAAMFRMMHEDVEPGMLPSVLKTIESRYRNDFDAWARAVFSTSILTDRKRLDAFLAKPSLKVLDKDPGFQATVSCNEHYSASIQPAMEASAADLARGYRLMVAALREKDPGRAWYPNANSTMRLTYGLVGGYRPTDGALYHSTTSHRGIIEKEDPADDEFIVPGHQKELLLRKDFGRYADGNGDLVLCFVSGNDITNGNSGSPVLNANGELIGIAFDGNWEAMSGDFAFEPDLQRTISVDIRYVLWTIDKYAGAKHIVDEMTVVERKPEIIEAVSAPGHADPVPAPALTRPQPVPAVK